jgi:hypothetical protein
MKKRTEYEKCDRERSSYLASLRGLYLCKAAIFGNEAECGGRVWKQTGELQRNIKLD